MRFNTLINNVKCKEWGLNSSQGALFDILNQLSSWAKEEIIQGKVFYHISRHKVISEIPLFYSKPDTVYRHFKILREKGLVNYNQVKRKDYIRLTDKGKTWNSDSNPSKLGNKSVLNSEMNPTNNNTSNNNTNIKQECEWFILYLNRILKKSYRKANAHKLKQRLKTFTMVEIKQAIFSASKSQYHIDEGFRYLTPEYFTRSDETIDKWLNAPKPNNSKQPKGLMDDMDNPRA